MKLFKSKLLFAIFCLISHNLFAQSYCRIYGTITNHDGSGKPGQRIVFSDAQKSGSLLWNGTRSIVTNTSGYFFFSIEQGAIVRVQAPVAGFDVRGGTNVIVPAQDSVALASLQVLATISTPGLKVESDGSVVDIIDSLNFSDDFSVAAGALQRATVSIADLAVDTGELANSSVTGAKILDNTILDADIGYPVLRRGLGFVADYYGTLSQTLSAAKDSSAFVVLSSEMPITARDTVHAGVTIKIEPGGLINNDAALLTIAGNVETSKYQQIFSNPDSVSWLSGQPVYLDWFGANPKDTASDSAAFRGATGSGAKYFKLNEGTYRTSEDWSLLPDSVVFTGIEFRTVVAYQDSATGNMFGADSRNDYALFENIIFDGKHGISSNTSALVRTSGRNTTFKNCTFQNHNRSKLTVQSTSTDTTRRARNVVVDKCIFRHGNVGDSNIIEMSGFSSSDSFQQEIVFTLQNSTFYDSSGAACVELDDNSGSAKILNNWFYGFNSDSATGSAIEADDHVGKVLISGNHIENSSYGWLSGINAQRGDSANIIANNYITGTFNGINITASGQSHKTEDDQNSKYTILSSNQIHDIGATGITMSQSGSVFPRFLNINGNVISNVGLDAPSTAAGIVVQCDSSLVVNNIVMSRGAASDSMNFGIQTQAGADGNLVAFNIVDGAENSQDISTKTGNIYFGNNAQLAGDFAGFANVMQNFRSVTWGENRVYNAPIMQDSVSVRMKKTVLADDATTAVWSTSIYGASSGWGRVSAGNNAEYASFIFSNTTVSLDSTNNLSANIATSDSDGNLCIYFTSNTLTIKNRLGSAQKIMYRVEFSAN